MDPSDRALQRVARARAARSVDEAIAAYREWATEHDEDVFGALGFTGSVRIADLLGANLPARTASVLDLGCGSGAVGPGGVAEVRRVLRPGATVAWAIGSWERFAPLFKQWEVLHRAVEPIRRGGGPGATVLVAKRPLQRH